MARNNHRLALALPLLVALGACTSVSGWYHHHFTHHASSSSSHKKIDATDFVTQLSDATLQLEHGGALDDVGDNLKLIENYTAQKNAAPEPMTVAVLDYKVGKKNYKIIAPMAEYSLSYVTADLDAFEHTMADVRVATITVSPHAPIKFSGKDSAATLQTLQAREQMLIAAAAKLPVKEDARQQLTLLQFFIDHHQKESAYLCADNAKRLIASAARSGNTDELTQDLSDLETRLRREMPY